MERTLDILYCVLRGELSRAYPNVFDQTRQDALHYACERLLAINDLLPIHSSKDWLFTVALNYLGDEQTRAKKHLSLELIEIAEEQHDVERYDDAVDEILLVLKEEDRIAYLTAWLYYYPQGPFDQISEMLTDLGYPFTALRKRLELTPCSESNCVKTCDYCYGYNVFTNSYMYSESNDVYTDDYAGGCREFPSDCSWNYNVCYHLPCWGPSPCDPNPTCEGCGAN